MSMQEVREQNIALVTQTALACFVENGIEKTTIRDIAQHARQFIQAHEGASRRIADAIAASL